MKIERLTEIETTDIQIGDRLRVGRYTATCQKVTKKGATFLLDQYLDRPMPMNKKNTNHGGYDNSDIRKYLQSDTVLSDFEEIRPYMKPWNNGDLPKNQVKYLPEKCVQNASISGLQARWMNERRNDVCSHGKWRRKMGKI